MSERTADPSFQDYSTLTPDKAEDFTFGGHMYHTTSDGKMFLPNAEIPGQDVEIGTDEARTIMAGRKYDAYKDNLRTEQMNRDKPVPIENPDKLEGTTPYDLYRAEKRGDTEYHYVNSLPRRPWTEADVKDYANNMGKVGATAIGAVKGAQTGAKYAGYLGPEAVPFGTAGGAIAGGYLGFKNGEETVIKGIDKMKEYGIPPMKAVEREGNKVFIESRPPGQLF